MDSGLRVQWPLSPYATALAAGALFAFCFAFWKHRIGAKESTEEDPSGLIFGRNLDPKKEKDVCKKFDGEKKKETEAARSRNFPVLRLRDVTRGLDYEQLYFPGRFGTLPRTTSQRIYRLESPNLYTSSRLRSIRVENENWKDFNSFPPNFSRIPQQSLCFGSELAKLNERFFLNLSPYFQPYMRQFRDIQVPETLRSHDFDHFNVALKPEILKNKPITRSAVCLALEKQLHKFLEEPFREINFSERAIQTIEISEDEEAVATGYSNQSGINVVNSDNDDSEVEYEHSSCPEKVSLNSNLWDSGYHEKGFDERSSDIQELKEETFCVESKGVEDISNSVFESLDSETDVHLTKKVDTLREEECHHETVTEICASESLDSETDIHLTKKVDTLREEECHHETVTEICASESLDFETDVYLTKKLDTLSEEECHHETVTEICISENLDTETEAHLTKKINLLTEEECRHETVTEICISENLDTETDAHLTKKVDTLREEECHHETVTGICISENLDTETEDHLTKKINLLSEEECRHETVTEVCNPSVKKSDDHLDERREENQKISVSETITEFKIQNSNNLNTAKYSYILEETCKNQCDEDGDKKPNTEEEFTILNENYIDDSQYVDEKLDFAKDSNLLEFIYKMSFSQLSDDDKTKEFANRDITPQISVEHDEEMNLQLNVTPENISSASENFEDIKNLTFEDNVDRLFHVNKCSDKELGSYHEEIKIQSTEENICKNMDKISDIHIENDADTMTCKAVKKLENFEIDHTTENFCALNLEPVQNASASRSEGRHELRDGNHSPSLECSALKENNVNLEGKISCLDVAEEKDSIECLTFNLENTDLEKFQNLSKNTDQLNILTLSTTLETKLSEKRNSRDTETASPPDDVTEEGSSRDSVLFDEKGAFNLPRQMDRETGERSVAVESTVTTETTLKANGDARLSTAVVSRLTLDDWSVGSFEKEDSVSVKTTVSEEVFRPTFEEFVPLKSSEKILKSDSNIRSESLDDLLSYGSRNGNDEKNLDLSSDLPSSPRVDRLKGLISRDEERRARTKFHHLDDNSHVGGAMEGEWDRLLRDVLASVSELERWERRHCDVSSDAEDAEQQHHFSQSDSSFTMEEEALSPKGETPTKVKSLRFKLDPDIYDVPSDDSFYDDDEDNRRVWKKQSKYRAFSSLELKDEPVRLVSVHASVVPAGQKMVARPVGIDLRVRLTEERQSKRAHVSTSPSQAKRRSPVSDRSIGWCQELSPVTENVDWRETFTPVTSECKTVPNGILKTPSPKIQPSPIESPNPFKLENGIKPTTNGVSPTTNGVSLNGVTKTNGVDPEHKKTEKAKYSGWKPPIERKPFLIIRKKFEPDPEAIERITGYRSALSKPPLPPPPQHKLNSNAFVRNKAEIARKQYLDNKAALANSKVDGSKKFQQFVSQAQSDRAKIVTSVPDLAAIERAVTEQWTKERASVSPRVSPGREDNKKIESLTVSRGSTPDDKWASYVQTCKQHLGRRSQSMSYLETDIDIIPVLDEDDKCQSTSALDETDEALPDPDDSDLDRSREDLDDSGRAKSEHEIRIERSLRSLPVPEWYRRSDKTKAGFLLGSSNKEKRGWAAVKSLASSTSSLASCGLRRPIRSLRSSRENIPWSRSSSSPDGPTLSLALAKAFREPYLGWRARTPTSSGVSSSPRASPPSWAAITTDDETNNVSFDGEDAFGRTTSSEDDRKEPLSLDDTGADAVTVSMDTNDPVKLPGGEDTCDDINNMSMDTCELFDASVVVPVDEDPSPQADTGDDIDNLSTDTTTTENRKLNDPKLKRYSYSQSIYHSEWDDEEESRGDRKCKEADRESSPTSADHKVVWIESSFVGSRTTTSIVVMPEKKPRGNSQERPASR